MTVYAMDMLRFQTVPYLTELCNSYGYHVQIHDAIDHRDKERVLQIHFIKDDWFLELRYKHLGEEREDELRLFINEKLMPYLDPWVQYEGDNKCSESTSTTELMFRRTIVCTSGSVMVKESL